jgi:hypothetical protein
VFKDLAQKLACSKEEALATFKKEVKLGKTFCVMSPDASEAICFDPQEIQDLIAELSSGKISLANLTEQLNLSSYQIHLVIEYLLKTGQIAGELTYNTFTSNSASKLWLLQKTSKQKREHRRKMREKRK